MDLKLGASGHTLSKCSILSINEANGENKFYKMKQVISAIERYLKTRSDDEICTINKYFQALSLAMDITIFDPHTNIASKFFITMYDLINILDPRSLTSWYCVDVLLNARKNPAARQALIKTYNFLPCLAKLVADHLSEEKKIKLLKLMQDITCGIKIFWQVPNITHLITTLCKWIETQTSDVISLSLGLLVNLCYKNVSSICILQRNIDIKKFIRMCLALKGPMVEFYVCQMMFILEKGSGYVPPEVLPKLIHRTFTAVVEAFKKNDGIVLKQIVEFFMEIIKDNHSNQLNCYSTYEEKINGILEMIEKSSDTRDPECLLATLDFIRFLIENKVPQFTSLYPKIVSLALEWIQESTVSYEALALLRTIAVTTKNNDQNNILESLVVGLPMFILIINSFKDDSMILNAENTTRLGAVIQLLTAMIHIKTTRKKVVPELDQQVFVKILSQILGDESPQSSEYSCRIDALNLYVYSLALVAELAEFDGNWQTLRNRLLSNKQINVLLAQAICLSPVDVKKLALELSSKSCLDGVALALGDSQSMLLMDSSSCLGRPQASDINYSIIPVTQNERLDNVLETIENRISRNNMGDIATSELMELYNYKMSYLAQAERAALSSLEAATKQCTHLQHRITRLTSEQTRLQQSEFYNIQKLEETTKKLEEMIGVNRDLQNQINAESGKLKACQSQLKIKERALNELEVQHKETETKLAQFRDLVAKMEEQCRRNEKNIEKKEEMLKNANATINNYSLQVQDLEKALAEKQKQLDMTSEALKIKSAILENITKMANSQL